MGWSETRSMYGGVAAYSSADNNGGTDTSIVAAVSGKQIVIDRLIISADAASATFFESDTTQITPTLYTGAGGTIDIDDLNWRTASGVALTYTAVITGNISIVVFYHLL